MAVDMFGNPIPDWPPSNPLAPFAPSSGGGGSPGWNMPTPTWGNWGDLFGNFNNIFGFPTGGGGTGGSSGGGGGGASNPQEIPSTASGASGFDWTKLISPGLSALGGLLGYIFGGPSGTTKAQTAAATNLANQMASNAGVQGRLGGMWGAMATPGLGAALNYWMPQLTGNRQAMMQALGPQISAYSQAQQQGLNNVSQFAPRSGARLGAEMPSQQAAWIGNTMMNQRNLAAGNVADISGGLGNMATSALTGSSTGYGGAANAYLNMVNQSMLQQQNQLNTAAGIGSGLYSALKGVDWSKIFGGGG